MPGSFYEITEREKKKKINKIRINKGGVKFL